MKKRVAKTVILGGGTAGWMTAAALSRAFGATQEIVLIESDRIGTVGVGEATVPSLRDFNRYLKIDEDDFIRRTGATFKLGIEFVNWNGAEARYFHPFGYLGPDMSGVEFHHIWLRFLAAGGDPDYGLFNPETLAARQGRFARNGPHGVVNHAFHLDAGRYAAFLRDYAEAGGVRRIEGELVETTLSPETGDITHLRLRSGEVVSGDLFVDCSGFRGLLIEEALGSGYVDWSHWLPCDRAVAVGSGVTKPPLPYTQSTAREAGWQWRIPLQHRTGNGYVYCSRFLGDDEATERLLGRLDTAPVSDPSVLRFRAGHRRTMWKRNCVAIGLASGFLEPLESTSIHLIQTAIFRLLALFPGRGISPHLVDRFNRETIEEYETVRDFVIAHYALASGVETPFWEAVRAAPIPDTLAARLETFRDTGIILYENKDLFRATNWFCVMMGQGWRPSAHHPLADTLPDTVLAERMTLLRRRAEEMAASMPAHADFIARHCAMPDQAPLSSATTS